LEKNGRQQSLQKIVRKNEKMTNYERENKCNDSDPTVTEKHGRKTVDYTQLRQTEKHGQASGDNNVGETRFAGGRSKAAVF